MHFEEVIEMIVSNNKYFSVEYNTRLQGFINGKQSYVAALDGKIRTTKTACPNCGRASYVDNGFHVVRDKIVRALHLNIKVSQFCCKNCGTLWSSNRELIDAFIQKEKDFVKCLLIGAARQGLSLANAARLAQDVIGHTYSPQYLHELYVAALEQVKQERFTSASGVYYYDEQFLLVNGEEMCRLVLRDTVTEKIILDTQAPNAKKKTIMKALRKALKGLPVDAFIVDLNQHYPELIHELYPKAKVQWCIFHLYKLVWKEFHNEFGKTTPLQQLYNAYLLFNIFFDHQPALEKLAELLKKFTQYKFNNEKQDQQVEHCLLQEFRQFVRALKKERRRNHEKVHRRTLKQSVEIFARIKTEITLFPTALQKRIRFIDDNWEKFTLFQHDTRVQPTNNGVEQYFGATLSKTEKKDFRSKDAVSRELRAHQAEWNGHVIFSTSKMLDVLNLTGTLFLAFPPT